MDTPVSGQTLAELDLACARSRRRAARRRAVSVRRAAMTRRGLRSLVVVIASLGLVAAATQVEPVSAKASPPTKSSSTPRVPALPGASCGIPREFAGAFRAASRETGLSLSLLAAVAWEESRMDPNAVSPAGAQGLLQLMPGTAKIVGVTKNGPGANVLAGARYLRLMVDRFRGDLELALAAYNAGPTAVEKAGGAPWIETLRYTKKVEARAASLTGCA
jgi:soluble lytic murein transglycosylase-like protein